MAPRRTWALLGLMGELWAGRRGRGTMTSAASRSGWTSAASCGSAKEEARPMHQARTWQGAWGEDVGPGADIDAAIALLRDRAAAGRQRVLVKGLQLHRPVRGWRTRCWTVTREGHPHRGGRRAVRVHHVHPYADPGVLQAGLRPGDPEEGAEGHASKRATCRPNGNARYCCPPIVARDVWPATGGRTGQLLRLGP